MSDRSADGSLMSLPRAELDRLVDRAAERGARRVLTEIGLDNGDTAARDIRELRDLIHAWRAARRTVWQTAVRILTTALILALIAGVALKLKLFGELP